ncbi:MAG: MotA/TolQ/ExbB proton channel family protein [Eubacteriales bacterium]|jgi:biopolymer transport protein ExbB/TolQ|nr:MotA/TolQ/ExbB proton channel family protein [Eubacteriales bacterium]
MPEQLLSLLGTNLVDFLVYGAIALVVLVGVCKCIYPVFRNGSLLNRAVAKLEKTAGNNQRPSWREPRFLGRALRNEWQKFLLNAGQLDVRGMPCDIEDYINEDSVIDKPGHSQLAELIPSLLTSLGILGTFIGLMEGLTSVNFSDAQGTMDSIPLLLTGMRFAFATSVAGITCSLLFNMFYRMSVGRACRALDSFDEAFYELAMPRPLSPEVQLICQKQDEEERLARIAEAVGNRVASSLEMAVSRAMDPLTKSLDTFIQGATQEQVEGVRRIVGQFVSQMNAQLSGQMTTLGHTMEMVSQGQLQTQKNLQNTLNAAQAMAADAQAMQVASAQMAQALQSWAEELKNSQTKRTEEAAMLEEQNQNLRQELELLTRSLADMRIAADRLTSELDDQMTQNDLSLPG